MSKYWKSVIATVAAILITTIQAVQASLSDGAWTTEDTLITIIAFLGAVLVYAKGNTTASPQAHTDKSVISDPSGG